MIASHLSKIDDTKRINCGNTNYGSTKTIWSEDYEPKTIVLILSHSIFYELCFHILYCYTLYSSTYHYYLFEMLWTVNSLFALCSPTLFSFDRTKPVFEGKWELSKQYPQNWKEPCFKMMKVSLFFLPFTLQDKSD